MHTVLDKSGRVLIPRRVREDLGLSPGMPVIVEQQDSEVRIRPVRRGAPLVRKAGVLVFTGAATGDIAGAVRRQRSTRARAVARGSTK